MYWCGKCNTDMNYIGDGRYECPSCHATAGVIPEDGWNDDDDETLSVYDAALIWASNGKDEDYMCGYTEEELENAL